jgi:hypothetical protein
MSAPAIKIPETAQEWEILAHRWGRLPEHERDALEDAMTRAQWRRFERTMMKLEGGQRTFEMKLTTRQDVAQILALYIDRHVLPIAARLDSLERWVGLPWYRKLGYALLHRWQKVVAWLASKGIRFVRDEEDAGTALAAETPESVDVPPAVSPPSPATPQQSAIEVVSR